MRLQRLTGLERDKIRAEYDELMKTIAELRAILGDSSDASLTKRLAGTIFLIRVLSAGLAYFAQVLLAQRGDLAATLRAGARSLDVPGTRFRSALLVLQGALSVVLLVGAALFVGSLRAAQAVPKGYDLSRVLVASPRAEPIGHRVRDRASDYEAAGVRVIGVSPDPVSAIKKFADGALVFLREVPDPAASFLEPASLGAPLGRPPEREKEERNRDRRRRGVAARSSVAVGSPPR